MALFGSAFEVTSSNDAPSLLLSALLRRHTAIKAIRRDICHQQDGLVPTFLASIVLAAGEVLLGDQENALMHLKGAFESLARVLGANDSLQPVGKYLINPASGQASGATLHTLALCSDMHTAWYRLGQPPELPPSFKFNQYQNSAPDLPTDGASTLALLHSCYHFANSANHYKYQNPSQIPSSIVQEQSRWIAILRSCDDIRNASSAGCESPKGSHQSSMLRAQCLSALIYTSMILNPYEIGYDTYDSEFSQIVHIADIIIATGNLTSPVASLPRFRMEPGLFQPLWLTATKCRHPITRRRAVQLLDQVGSEGPWSHRVMAAIARRAIRIEEESGCFPVPEAHRIHGCGVYPTTAESSLAESCFQPEFSLCRDVDDMVMSPDSDDERHWIIWREDLDLEARLPDPLG